MSFWRGKVPVWLQLGFVFFWMGIFISLAFIGDNSEAATQKMEESMSPAILRFGAVFQALIAFIFPAFILSFSLREEKLSFLTLGKKIHPLWILSAIFIIFFSLPLVQWLGEVNAGMSLPASLSGVETWMKHQETSSSKMSEILLGDRSTGGIVMNLVVMAFVAAFSEELFFRGLLQKLLMETRMNAHVAIWIAAFVFSAFHLQFYGFFPRLVLGGLIGYLFYFTGSLWISIMAHFLNNALFIVISYASGDNTTNPLETAKDDPALHMSWSMVGLSVMLIIGVLYFLARMKKSRESSVEEDM